MDATPSLHATWRTSRTRRLIAGAGITAALAASVLLPVPARAITTETAATLTETQKKVEESAAAFDEASKNLDELQEQIAKNEARIAEIEQKLPAAQEKASRAMREMYKHSKGSNPLMSFVLNTQSLDALISGMKYMDQVNDANVGAVRDLSDMQAELETEKTKLNTAKVQAEAEKQTAADALEQAQRLREAAQAQADAEVAAETAALQQAAGANGTSAPAVTPNNSVVNWDMDQASFVAQAQADAEVAAETAALQQAAGANGTSAPAVTPNNSVVNWDMDQASFVAEWAPRIDAYLAGSPLEGQGATFANAAWTYGVDPRFSPAISNTESSKGRHCFRPHNAWGWGNSSWGSWEEAINAHVSGLARGYGYTISVQHGELQGPPLLPSPQRMGLGQRQLGQLGGGHQRSRVRPCPRVRLHHQRGRRAEVLPAQLVQLVQQHAVRDEPDLTSNRPHLAPAFPYGRSHEAPPISFGARPEGDAISPPSRAPMRAAELGGGHQRSRVRPCPRVRLHHQRGRRAEVLPAQLVQLVQQHAVRDEPDLTSNRPHLAPAFPYGRSHEAPPISFGARPEGDAISPPSRAPMRAAAGL